MKGSTELTPDHFWISRKAEDEYRAVNSGIDETAARLMQAENRLVIFQAVAYTFSEAVRKSSSIRCYGVKSPPDSSGLSLAFNPFWLEGEGTIRDVGLTTVQKSLATVAGNLILRKVDRRIMEAQPHGVYEKRIEWYTPRAEASMSHLEYQLKIALYPFIVRWSFYDQLLEEVIREVHAFSKAMNRQLILKFHPDSVTPSPPGRELTVGTRMLDSQWTLCGKWEIYQFPEAVVSDFVDSIYQRLQRNIMATVREVIRLTDEKGLLSRQLEKIRILHDKPLVFREFWSLLGTGVVAPEPNTVEADSSPLLRDATPTLVQISQAAESRVGGAARSPLQYTSGASKEGVSHESYDKLLSDRH